MCERMSVYVSQQVSVCVCCTHLFSFFPLVFVLVNDLLFSGFLLFLLFLVCFRNVYNFVSVVVCFFLLYAFEFCVYCHV